MMRGIRLRSVLGTACVIAAIAFAVWLDWQRIVGTPAWLTEIGFLNWLKGLAPLDQWFIAVGTVSAVAYAIFSETFLSWWRRPKLGVLFQSKEPYVIQIQILRRGHDPNPSVQVRLLIRNNGVNRAEAVSLYARRLFRRDGSHLTPLEWFIPMDLKWAEDEKALTAISPGVERTCNVIGIEKPGGTMWPALLVPQAPQKFDSAETCFAHVQTISDPTNFSNWVFPGSYRMEIVVSAANAESQFVDFDFWFDGSWFDDRQDMIPRAATFSVKTRFREDDHMTKSGGEHKVAQSRHKIGHNVEAHPARKNRRWRLK